MGIEWTAVSKWELSGLDLPVDSPTRAASAAPRPSLETSRLHIYSFTFPASLAFSRPPPLRLSLPSPLPPFSRSLSPPSHPLTLSPLSLLLTSLPPSHLPSLSPLPPLLPRSLARSLALSLSPSLSPLRPLSFSPSLPPTTAREDISTCRQTLVHAYPTSRTARTCIRRLPARAPPRQLDRDRPPLVGWGDVR